MQYSRGKSQDFFTPGTNIGNKYIIESLLNTDHIATSYLAQIKEKIDLAELILPENLYSKKFVVIKQIREPLIARKLELNHLKSRLELIRTQKPSYCIPPIEVIEFANKLLVVRPFINAPSLEYIIDIWGKITQDNNKISLIVSILWGITKALTYLTPLTPHGSLVPGNIFITPNGVYLTDGGIVPSINLRELILLLESYKNYKLFFPPEIKTKYTIESSTDIFMLGVCLKYLFTGRLSNVIEDTERSLLPVEIISILSNLLDPDPTRRSNDLIQVVRELALCFGMKVPPIPEDLTLLLKEDERILKSKDDDTIRMPNPFLENNTYNLQEKSPLIEEELEDNEEELDIEMIEEMTPIEEISIDFVLEEQRRVKRVLKEDIKNHSEHQSPFALPNDFYNTKEEMQSTPLPLYRQKVIDSIPKDNKVFTFSPNTFSKQYDPTQVIKYPPRTKKKIAKIIKYITYTLFFISITLAMFILFYLILH